MSKVAEFIGKIASSGATNVLDSVANNIDQFVETKDEKREALQALAVAQIELNKQEAKHRNVFVSGWRPAIGYVCALGLFLYYPVRFGVATWLWAKEVLATNQLIDYPIDAGDLMQLVLGMLGMAGLRTYEKKNRLSK